MANEGGGMGMPFADVANRRKLGRHEWSKTAPEWRKAKPGLCLEGVYTNKDCKADGKKIIYSHGFTGESGFCFENADGRHVMCPICGQWVNPTTCGFNNCDWKVTGKRWLGMKKGEKEVDGEFQRADNAYYLFDDDPVQWNALTLIAVRNGEGCKKMFKRA